MSRESRDALSSTGISPGTVITYSLTFNHTQNEVGKLESLFCFKIKSLGG